jgi:coproporphyrinogen III oxidase
VSERVDIEPVRAYLLELQDRLCSALEELEEASGRRFGGDSFASPEGGRSQPRALADGQRIEKAAVHFSHTRGRKLPLAATERRPELAGRAYEAVSMSSIVHPRNPHAPTAHCNVRAFLTNPPRDQAGEPVWWFGGGFDLTPTYGYKDDAVAWHRAARQACQVHSEAVYPRFKKACDEYFFLRHRGEARGVGGIFFDDFTEGGFERCFALMRAVGDAFVAAYLPILRQRSERAYGERERAFQLYRRGRYAEFNLVWDRGTRFGIESGGRVESILASLPPLVTWIYDYQPEPGSVEGRLVEDFLKPRDWLADDKEIGKTETQ